MFKTTYDSNIGDKLAVARGLNGQCDTYAVSILKNTDDTQKFKSLSMLSIFQGGHISLEVTGKKFSGLLLELPVIYTTVWSKV